MILYHYKEMVSWILSITATGSVGESTIATEKSQIRVDVYTVSSWKRGYFTCQKKGPLWNIAAEFWMLEFKHLGSRGVTMGAEVKIVKPRSCNHPCLDEFHRDVHMSHWNHSFSAKSSQDCIASVSWRLVKYSNNQWFLRSKELWVVAIDSLHGLARWLIWNRPLSARNLSKLGTISKQNLIQTHHQGWTWIYKHMIFLSNSLLFLGVLQGVTFFEGNSCDSTIKSI